MALGTYSNANARINWGLGSLPSSASNILDTINQHLDARGPLPRCPSGFTWTKRVTPSWQSVRGNLFETVSLASWLKRRTQRNGASLLAYLSCSDRIFQPKVAAGTIAKCTGPPYSRSEPLDVAAVTLLSLSRFAWERFGTRGSGQTYCGGGNLRLSLLRFLVPLSLMGLHGSTKPCNLAWPTRPQDQHHVRPLYLAI